MKCIKISKYSFILLLTIFVFFHCKSKLKWNGDIINKENFVIVENQKNPVFQENSQYFSLKEISRIGKEQGDSSEVLGRLVDVAVDSKGYIYVLEPWYIKKFTPEGNFINIYCKPGAGPGELFGPKFIFINRNNFIFIYEDRGKRISVFDSNLHFLRHIKIFDNSVFDIVADSQENLYIGSYNNKKVIHKYSNEGTYTLSFGEVPLGFDEYYAPLMEGGKLGINSKEEILLIEPNEYKIRIFNVFGNLIKKINVQSTLFYPPTIKEVDEKGHRLQYEAGVSIMGLIVTKDDYILNQYYDRHNMYIVIDLLNPSGIFLGRLKQRRKDITITDPMGYLLSCFQKDTLVFGKTLPFSFIRIFKLNYSKYDLVSIKNKND